MPDLGLIRRTLIEGRMWYDTGALRLEHSVLAPPRGQAVATCPHCGKTCRWKMRIWPDRFEWLHCPGTEPYDIDPDEVHCGCVHSECGLKKRHTEHTYMEQMRIGYYEEPSQPSRCYHCQNLFSPDWKWEHVIYAD